MSAKYRPLFVIAHEIGHVLTNDGHAEAWSSWTPAQIESNLMREFHDIKDTGGRTVRQPMWYHYLGVLALAGVGYLIVFVSSTHTPRPANERPPDRPPPPVRVELPTPPQPEPKPSPFTAREQVILRHIGRGSAVDTYPPDPADVERQARRDREFDAAGGNSPAAFPFFLRLLERKPPIEPRKEASILHQVARIPGDRSAFRKPAVQRLGAYDSSVARAAMYLLTQIAEPEDAQAVAAQFKFVEFDDTIEKRDHAYFALGLPILTKYGSEAEIAKIDQAKHESLLWDDDKFWAKVEACKKAIRERLAKEKEKADKE